VGLEEHEVARIAVRIAGTEEMVEPDLEDLRRGRVARDMAAEVAVCRIGAHHHGQGVPAHDRGDPLLHGETARIGALALEGDGVAVGREGRDMGDQAELLALHLQLLQQVERPLAAALPRHGFERVEPFGRLARILVQRRNRAVRRGFNTSADRHDLLPSLHLERCSSLRDLGCLSPARPAR
jgi:hypothetical protein